MKQESAYMAKSKEAEAKGKTEAKAETKVKKAAGPEITGIHKFNPCRQYAASRSGGSRPSERLFLVDEVLRANGTSFKEIQSKAAARWATAARAAGDKRTSEDLVKVYNGQIPVNPSTMKYLTDKMDLAAVVLKKRDGKLTIKVDEKAGTVTSTFK